MLRTSALIVNLLAIAGMIDLGIAAGSSNSKGMAEEMYESNSDEKKQESILLHYLPHTSLEVAAFGSTKEAYENYVRSILESLIGQLSQNDEYKFNWSEVTFLEMWWNDRNIKPELK